MIKWKSQLTACLLATVLAVAAMLVFRSGHTEGLPERTGVPMGDRVEKTDAAWRQQLTPEQYRVTRGKGTERPFTGAYWNTKEDGVYCCVCCGQPLFEGTAKFDSACGWPSYFQPTDENSISLREDKSHFMRRIEVVCSCCDAHLGHVFEDGPPPTGLRYCINSASLRFTKRGEEVGDDKAP